MLREALNYLSKGYSVIPLKPKGKEPLLNWKEFQQRRASETEVKEWLTKWPDMNIGVVTGSISNLAVVDVDGAEGIKSIANLKLDSKCISLSGNGRHLWYQNQAGLGNSVKSIPGLDVRAEGGYIVVPPSIHPSGTRYRYLGRGVCNAEQLSPFPTAIFAESVTQTSSIVGKSSNEPDWIVKALEEMTLGNIDTTLHRICSWFRNANSTEATCAAFVRPYAERAGATSGHLEDKIRNVWARYEPKDRIRIEAINGAVQSYTTKLQLHSPSNAESVLEYDKRQQQSRDGMGEFNTGYPKFDALTKGLRRGELLTVAARTGVGKTNWILNPIKSFCETGKKVILFSTEMSFDQIWSRYTSLLMRPEDFRKQQFFICDEFTPNPERIEEALKEVMPDLFVFDHINHVGTEHHELAKFMMALKELARKFNIPGIVTAQLSRSADWVENGERVSPRLSMIKGSSSIEEISAQVLLLSEKRVHETHTEIEGIVDKNRHGDKGLVTFGLMKQPYRMVEL